MTHQEQAAQAALAGLSDPERRAVDMIVHTSVADAQLAIRGMSGTESHLRILRAAELAEAAGSRRHTIIASCRAAAKRFAKALPAAPADIPAKCRAAIESQRDGIAEAEHQFAVLTLPNRLAIGLHCLVAHRHFAAIAPSEHGKRGGRGKKGVTRDTLSFESWLASDLPWLKRAVAYKYMNGVTGLGLTADSSLADLAAALHARRAADPALTLGDLVAAAIGGPTPPPPPAPPVQGEFDFMRDTLTGLRQQAENILALRDTLRAHPEFERVAIARAYTLLFELTGSHWAPTDTAPEIAAVDPDVIDI